MEKLLAYCIQMEPYTLDWIWRKFTMLCSIECRSKRRLRHRFGLNDHIFCWYSLDSFFYQDKEGKVKWKILEICYILLNFFIFPVYPVWDKGHQMVLKDDEIFVRYPLYFLFIAISKSVWIHWFRRSIVTYVHIHPLSAEITFYFIASLWCFLFEESRQFWFNSLVTIVNYATFFWTMTRYTLHTTESDPNQSFLHGFE